MNIQQLKNVLEVQKTGSITQAANNLFMNQPNLSKSIKELEESLGILIFYRTPQGVTPTEKGEQFLIKARDIVSKTDELVRFCKYEDAKTISVAGPSASYISMSFASAVNQIYKTASSFSSYYSEQTNADIVDRVIYNQNTIGILRVPYHEKQSVIKYLKQTKLAHKIIAEFIPRLAFSNANPLVVTPEITREVLEEQIEITIEPTGNVLSLENTPDAARTIRVQDRTTQYLFLQEIPNTYLWSSPMPKKVLSLQRLVQKPMKGRTSTFVDIIIHLQGRKLTDVENVFVKELQKTIDSIDGLSHIEQK